MKLTYFIQAGENGPIKIGSTDHPQNRLSQLQVGHYEKLHILCLTFLCSERYAHQRFDDFAVQGEWFSPEEPLLSFIDKMNAANSHFPTAFDEINNQEKRGGIDHLTGHQYLLDLGKFGFNRHVLIRRKLKEKGETFDSYLLRLIEEDMSEEFKIIDELEHQSETFVKNAIKSGDPIQAS